MTHIIGLSLLFNRVMIFVVSSNLIYIYIYK